MGDDERKVLTKEEALAMLPDGDFIHTFMQSGLMLLGADSTRERILKEMEIHEFEISGEQATKMGHGIAFCGEHGWVFVETKAVK